MNETMEILDTGNREMRHEIHRMLQASYAIEAELLQAEDFPPLKRSAAALEGCRFYGFRLDDQLTAVAEIDEQQDHIMIDAFVVDPQHFRKGIGARFLRRLSTMLADRGLTILVDTARANHPALGLYRKIGFRVVKDWDHVDGTAMTRLAYEG